ncbi:MAG: phage Gp37/Gp68 family protein [Duncaniella sp.]|nr:phage Gp37/Gp68 family protein [Duncaniella sp.]
MHDIWNPWHGCVKASEGCDNCYMYFLDRLRGADGRNVYRTQAFDYPLQRSRDGGYKVKSGEMIRVCMTSDFFLDEADRWRPDAWRIMRERSDVKFFLLTKRPERVADHLPTDWGEGWENIFFNVSCENQRRADERIPILLDLPFKHKGVMCAPMIGPVEIGRYLDDGQIEQVMAGGENYDGARPCDFDWIRSLSAQCRERDVRFCFMETGNVFVKDGRLYRLSGHEIQSQMARKAGMNHEGKPIRFRLIHPLGFEIDEAELHRPYFKPKCNQCSYQMNCNGCSRCGKCGDSD